MEKNTLLYRGALKSCNYHCSYCPFSKHPLSEGELRRDREQWEEFYPRLVKTARSRRIGAVMLVPYGEALIHPWYWEGLAVLSQSPELDAVGAQSNFSFPLDPSIRQFVQAGGILSKLRIWATFHPEMVSVGDFAAKCREAGKAGLTFCAGAVGVPGNLDLIRKLRALLPEEIYLWVNQMDGLRRPYTQEEIDGFSQIDPYFYRELQKVKAEPDRCAGRFFAEGDGRLFPCNISRFSMGSWREWLPEEAAGREPSLPQTASFAPKCARKICSCYLAYGGRRELMNHVLFGPYPLFRIPRRPRAAFFDVDGTLIPVGNAAGDEPGAAAAAEIIPEDIQIGLKVLAEREHTQLFFATTLPEKEALKRCREVRRYFRGGVFAGGAHIRLDDREIFYQIPEECAVFLKEAEKLRRFSMLVYREEGEGRIYKITLLRPRRRPWKEEEARALFASLPKMEEPLRFVIEGHCMEILPSKADKAGGAELLCRWLGISPEDAVAAGDGEEDALMMERFP